MQTLHEHDLEEIAERFKALSEPSRLAILKVLMAGEAAVGIIASETGQSQPNVSRHLAALKRAGFVVGERNAQSIVYKISDPIVVRLCDLMCGSPPSRQRR